MSFEINSIALAMVSGPDDYLIKKLAIGNESLEELSSNLKLPSLNRLPEFEQGVENIFSTSTRFKISDLSDESYLFFLKKLTDDFYEKEKENEWLDSLDELYVDEGKQSFNPNLVLYKISELNNSEKVNEFVLINKFSSKMLIRDKTFLYFKKSKAADMDVTEIETTSEANYFVLPESNFICKLEEYKMNEDSKLIVSIFNGIELDEIFNLDNIIKDFAEKKIERFVNEDDHKKFKLTSSHADVFFQDETGVDRKNEVIEVIKKSNQKNLIKTYATFTGRGTKTIQKINLVRLNEVIDELLEYVDNPQTDCEFDKNEIPRIDIENNGIYVDEKSVKIFAAILNNEIIQKLLDGKIEIPYYSEV